MFESLQHLLPRGRALDIIIDKPLRRLFRSLGRTCDDAVAYVGLSGLDVFPRFTRRLPLWESQFGLPETTLTEQERRDRLTGAWRAVGGQSPGYIQRTLQAAGFSVFVHEWWVPGTDPPQARNPNLVLRDDGTAVDYRNELGTTLSELGDSGAELGRRSNAVGYLLVNKILDNAGNRVLYSVPGRPVDWPFVLYIGGATYPETAVIARRAGMNLNSFS